VELSLSDLVKISGRKPRAIQIETDAGVLRALPSTAGRGRGVHRRYDSIEVLFALIAGELELRKLPLAEVAQITNALRQVMSKMVKKQPTSAQEAFTFNLLRWAIHGRHPILIAINRQATGLPRFFLHAVGVDPFKLPPNVPFQWFTEPFDRKLIDAEFDMRSCDVIRLDALFAPARHLFARSE